MTLRDLIESELPAHSILTEVSGKLGDCYQVGGKYMLTNLPQDTLLVHGIAVGTGGNIKGLRFGHCWLEKGSSVIDLSNGKKIVMSKDSYYTLGKIKEKEVVRYTTEETMKNMAESGHYGPWDSKQWNVSQVSENIPEEKKEIGRQKIKISRKELNIINLKS